MDRDYLRAWDSMRRSHFQTFLNTPCFSLLTCWMCGRGSHSKSGCFEFPTNPTLDPENGHSKLKLCQHCLLTLYVASESSSHKRWHEPHLHPTPGPLDTPRFRHWRAGPRFLQWHAKLCLVLPGTTFLEYSCSPAQTAPTSPC